jgi:hypothetical protein
MSFFGDLKSNVSTAWNEIKDLWLTKNPKTWTDTSNQVVSPILKNIIVTTRNIFVKFVEATGLTLPIILGLSAIIIALLILRKYRL